jgi:uncharacterized protein YehS (DUF1456 family)
MDNNDILRRLRYALELNDNSMIKIFGLADHEVTREQVSNWLKKEGDLDFVSCNDLLLATFLNGFIILKRGKREGVQPKPEDVLLILEFSDFVLSKHELSAFFRKKDHKHYRECKDQILRNFIQGVQLKFREN